ncbi:MAG: hypothetical protein L3K17_08775 [Thermoplasmata archaeon]|nr:hypothetical protein [Thermoplasmata archaeon]
MDLTAAIIGGSLALLGLALAIVSGRALVKFRVVHSQPQLMWGVGLALGAAAMAVETLVYFGVVTELLLQAYVFFSAGIVGILSLGATRVLRNPRFEAIYTWYTLATCTVVAFASFLTPLSLSMVSQGVISSDPPLILLILSTLVTGPATVVLVGSSIQGLRRSRRWQTLLMVAGALVLGAGGTLYIASFPVALYYAEFLGIGLLFLGLISLPQSASTSTPHVIPAASGP